MQQRHGIRKTGDLKLLVHLDEQSMQEAAGDAGDAGRDDLELEGLKELAELDHGVSIFVAGDADHHRLLPHFAHCELRAMATKQISF